MALFSQEAVGLIFKLSADSKAAEGEFAQFKAVVGAQSSEIGKLLSDIGLSARSLGPEFRILETAVTAIGSAAKSAVNALSGLGASKEIASSASSGALSFKVLEGALLNFVGEAKEAKGHLSEFRNAINQAAGGNQTLATTFQKLGVDVKAALASPQQGLAQFLQGFGKIGTEAEKAAVAEAVFLTTSEGLVPALSAASTGMQTLAATETEAAVAATALDAALAPVLIAVAAVVAVAAAGTAALFGLSASAAETGTKIFDLADKTGISVRNLDLFRRAAAEAGKGIEIVERSFDQFTSRLENASKTTGELSRTVTALGLNPKTALQDVNKSLETVVKNLNAIENPAIRGAKAQELFGLRNEAIIPILTRIGESLDAYERRVGSLGQITDEQANQSKQFETSLNILKATFSGVAKSVGAELLPVFTSVIDLIQTVVRLIGEGLVTTLKGSQGTIRDVATGIDFLNARLQAAPAFIEVVKIALKEAGQAFVQFQQIIANTAGAAAKFLAGDFGGAFAAGSAAAQGIKNLGSVGDQTKAALAAAQAQVALNFTKLQADRAKLRVTGGNRLQEPPKAAKAEKDRSGEDELKLLKLQEQAAQREAEAEIAAARRAFEFRQITIEQLTSLTVEAEKKMLAAKEATFAAERAQVAQNEQEELAKAKTKQQRENAESKARLRLAEIGEREAAAQQKANEAIRRAQDERIKTEQAIFEQAAKARGERQEEELRQQITRIQVAADQRTITEEAAARKINDIEEQIFQQKRIRLVAEITLAQENSVERQRAADDLAKLELDRAAQVEAAQLRILEAQKRDLENLRRFLAERNKLLEDIGRGEVDALNRRAEALETRAQRAPGAVTQDAAQQARQQAQIADENFQNQLNQNRILRQQQEAEALATSEAQKQAIIQASHVLLEQEEQRHGDALAQIQSTIVSPFEQIKDVLKTAAQAFGETAIAAIASGQSIGAAMRQMAAAVLQQIAKIAVGQAIKNFAYGLEALGLITLTGNPSAGVAATHFFASAALWTGLAAASAIGAAAVGAGGGKAIAPSAGGGSTAQQSEPRKIEQGGPLNQPRPIIINLHGELRDGVLRVVHEDISNNGRTRELIRREAQNAG